MTSDTVSSSPTRGTSPGIEMAWTQKPEPARTKDSARDSFEQPKAQRAMSPTGVPSPVASPHPQSSPKETSQSTWCHDTAEGGAACCVYGSNIAANIVCCPIRCAAGLVVAALACVQTIVCCPCLTCMACAEK